MYEDSLVVTMVSQPREENAPSEQGDLKGPDVDIYTICFPSIRSDGQREKRRESSMEVADEEDGQHDCCDTPGEEDAA